MRTALLLLLLMSPAATPAVEIYRCEDRQGRQVFSDQPCRAIGALALPSARDLPAALPEDGAAEAEAAAEADRTAEPGLPPEPPAAASGCPGPTPEALGEALVRAAVAGNLNAIAGMHHWPSAGAGASGRVFAEARRLARSGPLTYRLTPPKEDDAWLWAGDPPPAIPRRLPWELELVPAGLEDAAALARYRLIQHAGCYWLPP